MCSEIIKEAKENDFDVLTWITMLLSIISVIVLGIEVLDHGSQLVETKTALFLVIDLLVLVVDRYTALKEYYWAKYGK